MADWKPPTQDRVEGYFKELNNWGRWGHDDQRGTANLITAAKRAQASSLVRTGRTVSLARDIGPQPAIMYNVTFPSSRERADVVLDRFDLVYHGFSITHIDALCHVAWDGELYNGRAFKDSLTAAGATWCAIDAYFDGLTTRGVLLDVAAGRQEGYVTVGQPVTPKELDAAAARAGIKVEPGDVVVVRNGDEAFRKANPDWVPRVPPPRDASVVSGVVSREGHRRDLVGHDGRAADQLSGFRDEHAPGHSVPGSGARGQLESGAARARMRRGRALRVPLHGDADSAGRLDGRPGASARDLLRSRLTKTRVRPAARRARAVRRRACGRWSHPAPA